MPEEKKPILDPESELPAGYDAQLDTSHTEKLTAGYETQLDPAQKKAATLPITHYQHLPKPGFFSRNRYLFFLLPIILVFVSGAIATIIVSDAQRKEQGPQPTRTQPTVTIMPSAVQKDTLYSNSLFKLSYPSSWTVQEVTTFDLPYDLSPTMHLAYKQQTHFKVNPNDSMATFVVTVFENPKAYTLNNIEKNYFVGAADKTTNLITPVKSEVTVGGLPAKEFSHFMFDRSQRELFVLNNNLIYLISYDGNNPNDSQFQSHLTQYQNMLASLSFDTTPQEKMCGGIAAIQCSPGYSCQLDGTYPDAGGHCVADTKPNGGLGVKPTAGPTLVSNQAVETAKGDLAHKIGRDVDTIQIVSVTEKEWSDSSLGCPKPGMMYLQVITPGYLVMLSDGTKQYEYHTTQTTRVVDCTK